MASTAAPRPPPASRRRPPLEKGRAVPNQQIGIIGHRADELVQHQAIHQADQRRRHHQRHHQDRDQERPLASSGARNTARNSPSRHSDHARSRSAEPERKPDRAPERADRGAPRGSCRSREDGVRSVSKRDLRDADRPGRPAPASRGRPAGTPPSAQIGPALARGEDGHQPDRSCAASSRPSLKRPKKPQTASGPHSETTLRGRSALCFEPRTWRCAGYFFNSSSMPALVFASASSRLSWPDQ